jgi:hypothetical protein
MRRTVWRAISVTSHDASAPEPRVSTDRGSAKSIGMPQPSGYRSALKAPALASVYTVPLGSTRRTAMLTWSVKTNPGPLASALTPKIRLVPACDTWPPSPVYNHEPGPPPATEVMVPLGHHLRIRLLFHSLISAPPSDVTDTCRGVFI